MQESVRKNVLNWFKRNKILLGVNKVVRESPGEKPLQLVLRNECILEVLSRKEKSKCGGFLK